jgi:hypothetical protein
LPVVAADVVIKVFGVVEKSFKSSGDHDLFHTFSLSSLTLTHTHTHTHTHSFTLVLISDTGLYFKNKLVFSSEG